MSAANHSMLNMAARYGNAPAVRALLKAGAEASHADATGWHMPLHHLTHCKGCSEEVALRIAEMLVAAGAEPGLARDKNGVAAAVTSSHRFARPLAPRRLPSAAGYASARPRFRPYSHLGRALSAICISSTCAFETQITATKAATRRGWKSVVRLLRARQAS